MLYLNRFRVALIMLLLMSAPAAFALTLQQAMENLGAAKEQGLIGEKPDGYLGVVKAEGNAGEIVQLINKARKAEYQRLAESNGISVKDVEVIAGKKAIERTQSGHYIYSGGWVRK